MSRTTKKVRVPAKVTAIAKKFQVIGKVAVEAGFHKTHWNILIGNSGKMDIATLFVIALQHGITRFTAIGYGKISLSIHI